MDASPLAQLNTRQQQIVLSPVEDISPLSQWEPPPQRQGFRNNSLPNTQLNRHYSSSFSSFSSTSTNATSYTNASSFSSAGGAGYFDLPCRKTSDLLSPMASLTADMSANLSLDPRYVLFASLNFFSNCIALAQDYLLPAGHCFLPYHLAHNSVPDNNLPSVQLPPTNILHLA